MRSGVRSPAAAGGIGAWVEFTRLRQILGEWGLTLAVLCWIAARPRFAWETAWAVCVWLAVVVFIHLLNDLEDAEADRLGDRPPRNPVATGAIDRTAARAGAWGVGVVSLAMACSLPWGAAAYAAGIWGVGALYSWRRARLKAVPCLDCVSHGLLAGATVLLFAGLAGSVRDAGTWWIAAGVSVFSAGGGLHNQLRDRVADGRAGLRNTAAALGVARARRLRLACYALGAAATGAGIWHVLRFAPERLVP